MVFQYGNEKYQRVQLHKDSYVFQKPGCPIQLHDPNIRMHKDLWTVCDEAPLLREDFKFLIDNNYLEEIDAGGEVRYWKFANGALGLKKVIYGSRVKKENRSERYEADRCFDNKGVLLHK